MSELTREAQVMRTFGKLADTLVAGYDVVDLLQTLVDSCEELLSATEAGILLADDQGYLEVVASTSESSALVELLQLGAEAGPGERSFETGQPIHLAEIARSDEWPEFRERTLARHLLSLDVFPLRLRDTIIGTLTVFRDSVGEMAESDRVAAQAFADVATIGILHERSLRESTIVREQLQHALGSRIVVEQAKGMVAHTRQLSVDDAFDLIRAYARAHRMGIGTVAAGIVARTLTL